MINYKIVKLQSGYFAIVKVENGKITESISLNWSQSMANYELGFYLDGTLSLPR